MHSDNRYDWELALTNYTQICEDAIDLKQNNLVGYGTTCPLWAAIN